MFVVLLSPLGCDPQMPQLPLCDGTLQGQTWMNCVNCVQCMEQGFRDLQKDGMLNMAQHRKEYIYLT